MTALGSHIHHVMEREREALNPNFNRWYFYDTDSIILVWDNAIL